MVNACQHYGVKSVIADDGRLFTTVLSPPRQMTSTHVPPGNLKNTKNFTSWFYEHFLQRLGSQVGPCMRLFGVANCHLSGAPARLTSVSSQYSEGRAHPHYMSATTQHSSESHGSLGRVCRAACHHAVPCASRRITPLRYFHRLTAVLLHQLVRIITRLHFFFFFYQMCSHDWGVD